MIHTKELRYGNRVRTQQGEVITVQQILSNTLIYDSQIEVKRELVHVRGSYQTDYYTQLDEVVKEVDCSEVEPIALNTEILRKSGFRNFVRDQWIIRIAGTNIDFEFSDGSLMLRSPAPAHSSIKYLHQLQNFLYAITSQEIAVEL